MIAADKIDNFIQANNLIVLEEDKPLWHGYIGSSIKYENEYIHIRHYTSTLKEFCHIITPIKFNECPYEDFKHYLNRRIKLFKLFNKDSKVEISKIVSIFNSRFKEKFPYNWWDKCI